MSTLQQPEGWDYKYIAPFEGLDVSIPANQINDGKLLTANNVFLDKGILKKETGYITFGSTVRGIPRITYQFYKKDGTSELMLISNATVYVWNISLSAWHYVSDGVDTTTTAILGAGGTNLTVASITGFSDGDFIGVILDDGTQHQTTINGAPAGSTIVMTDAVPVGRQVNNGAIVLKAVDLNGSLDIQVSVVTLASHDWFVFTNGVDTPRRYNGTTCEVIPNLPSSGNTVCRLVAVFNNHLILAHTTEGGTAYPQRVRRSDTGDPTNWTTGNAGYDDLFDSEDFIIATAEFGPYQMFYRERSIVRCGWLGTEDKLFDFETVVTGEGALSQDSVLDLGDYHVFVGNSNIYEYKGGFDVEPIGDDVYDMLFGNDGELNASYKQRSFGFYAEELDEILFFFPTGSDVNPNKFYRYNMSRKAWFTRTLSEAVVGFGLYQATNDKTWNDLIGTWADQTWNWNSRSVTANSPTTHLCGADVNQVYEYNYTATTDAGASISYEVETKDFGHPRYMIRYDTFDFRMKGTNVLVEYSIDEGLTWTTLYTITNSALTRVVRQKQIISQWLRLKLTGSSDFEFQSLGFVHMIESEH